MADKSVNKSVEKSFVRDVRHASLMQDVISWFGSRGFKFKGAEVLYEHYGARGFVDVLLNKENRFSEFSQWACIEVKPEFFDVGEAIRQVKKMKEYFIKSKGKELNISSDAFVFYPLLLEATEENFETWKEYWDLFRGIDVLFFDRVTGLDNDFMRNVDVVNAETVSERGGFDFESTLDSVRRLRSSFLSGLF